MDLLESRQGTTVRHIKKLLSQKKARYEQRQFVIEGARLVSDALACGAQIELLVALRGMPIPHDLCSEAFKVYEATEPVMRELTDTVTPQGVVAVAKMPMIDMAEVLQKAKGLVVLCDGIADPGNLGTIIRSADALGADAVVLLPGCTDVYSPKVIRATMSSIFHLPVVHCIDSEQCILEMKEHGYSIVGTSPALGQDLYCATLSGKSALIIGSEATGMQKDLLALCDFSVRIPMDGQAESLNAAVAASIAMYEAMRQRKTEK